MENKHIVVRGARENNLKNIDIDIPKKKMVVITGLSGSGKSSLAFDTIFAEGQRRYVESLSAYARQFLGGNEKPDVDSIDGLSPAVSIDQKTTSHNPRSTVGTVTELYDYIRLLFARIGQPFCINGHGLIKAQTPKQIVDKIFTLKAKSRLVILSPVIKLEKGTHVNVLENLRKEGYLRVRINGDVVSLDDKIDLEKRKAHNIEVVIDRVVLNNDHATRSRISDAVEIALTLSKGTVIIDPVDKDEMLFSENHSCDTCGFSIPELEPRLFSFNSPVGACTGCKGIGKKLEADSNLIMPYKEVSLEHGAVKSITRYSIEWQSMMALCREYNIPTDVPVGDLKQKDIDILMHGSTHRVSYKIKSSSGRSSDMYSYIEGIGDLLERRFLETSSNRAREEYRKYMSNKNCPKCKGKRLNEYALCVKIDKKNINEITDFAIEDAINFFLDIDLNEDQKKIGKLAMKEIIDRLSFLDNVGLGYLNLSRNASSLSGGESQRIRLATQIGSQLTDVLYVLDEPSIGLHPRDNAKLIQTLRSMRDLGNSVLIVEHDEETMLASDWLIDIGPKAGLHGGEVMAQGTPEEVMANPNSITGQYLSGKMEIPVPKTRRGGNGKVLEIKGCESNNLQNINVRFPLGKFISVTGVSGSGKSTLLNDTLYVAINNLRGAGEVKVPGKHTELNGITHVDKVVNISQDPIGRTPRSNPATYIGAFDDIRDIFSEIPESKARGYQKGRFSFNVKGGRCEACGGDGVKKIEMHFLPDVYVTCDECEGKRYNEETLQIRFKTQNISQVLGMTCEDALEFFKNFPKLKRKLQAMNDVGLGYIRLGQPATQLSGGEAQRVKLAKYLQKRPTGKSIFMLDEPTTGLHVHDVAKLIEVLNAIVLNGDTVICIEHNLDVMKVSDHIIDLGPGGGAGGGKIVATGTPEQVAKVPGSYTAEFLAKVLNKNK